MKTIPAIIAATLLLASASVSAEITKRSDSSTFVMNSVQTKQSAYQLGQSKLIELQTLSPRQLSRALQVHSVTADVQTLKLNNGGYVTVQEKMDANGEIAYVGLVKVDFSYLEIDDG